MMRKFFVLILSFALLSLIIPTLAQDATATPVQPTAEATQQATVSPAAATAVPTQQTNPTSQATAVPAQPTTAASAQPTAASAEQTAEATGEPMAFVRFANFVPNMSITFSADNNQLAASKALDYKAFGDWAVIQPGKYMLTASSSDANAAASEATAFDFRNGGWFTIAAVITPDNKVDVESIDQSFDKILPGTSSMTFVNATQGTTNVDFIRDDTTYAANLFPMGNKDNQTSWFNILDDANTYHFKVVENGKPDNVLVDAPNTTVTENELYLIAAVGNPAQKPVELVINNTDMSQIMLLQGAMQQPGTVIQAAAVHPELAAWLDAVQKAGLTDTLSGKGPFTVFVNANFDMSKLPDSLRNDPKALSDFLNSQIVAGDLRSKDIFKAGGTLKTLTGQPLNLTQENGNGYINNVQVIAVDIPATNGVIHVVNDFVTPPQ